MVPTIFLLSAFLCFPIFSGKHTNLAKTVDIAFSTETTKNNDSVIYTSNESINKNNFLKGTVLMAGICKDGIVLASDSRLFFKEGGEWIGHTDDFCKIFPLKQFLVATTGKTTLGSKFYAEVFANFNSENKKSRDIHETFKALRQYLLNRLSLSKDTTEMDINIFYGVGYNKNKEPLVIQFNKSNPRLVPAKGAVSNAPEISRQIHKIDLASMSYKEVGELFTALLEKYENGNGKYEAGGLTSVAVIKPDNSVTWLKNKFSSKEQMNFSDFFQSVVSEKRKVTYYKEDGKGRMTKLVEKLNLTR